MRMKTRWLTAALLVVGLAAAPAAQQEAGEFESRRIPGWTFVPGVTFGAIHDSNIGLATPPAHTERTDSDEVMLTAPFAQVEYYGRRTEFSAGYRGHVRRYMDVDELNSFDQGLSASLQRRMTRYVTLRLQNFFTDS